MARGRILYCGHRNAAMCPTHGQVVRDILGGRNEGKIVRRAAVTIIAPGKYLPIGYSITEKGRELLAQDRDAIWRPF